MATEMSGRVITFEGVSYDGRRIYTRAEVLSQDSANFTSTIQLTMFSEGGSQESYYIPKICQMTLYRVKDWTQACHWSGGTLRDYTQFPAIEGIKTHTHTIPHDEDGTLVLRVITELHIEDVNYSEAVNWTVPAITRDVRIVSAPNFNDEESPVITYVNDPNENTKSLTLELLSADGSKVFATREIPPQSGSYTLALTADERTSLWKSMWNVNDALVTFRLTSKIKSNFSDTIITFTDSVTKVCTLIEHEPYIIATVRKVSDDEGSLTGSGDVLILHRSDVYWEIDYGYRKNASPVVGGLKATCGSKTITGRTFDYFYDVESGEFVFSLTDSRGNTATHVVGMQYVDYSTLTCNLEIEAPTADGTLDFDITGYYSPVNFGETTNSLVIEYRYKVNEGEYGNWVAVTPTIYDIGYSAHVTLEGLDYRSMYRFQARATDKLQIAETPHVAVKTRPVFDWSEHDFNFNCPVTITDGYLKYPLMGIVNAMTKTYVCDVTTFDGANYSVGAAGATICGNILRCNFTATRNDVSGSGNIANETVCTFSVYHGGKINNMLNICFGNGANGHVASFLTSNVSYTAETLDFNIQVSATGGATNEFSTYFQIPISINLDKFVEE